jgi:hypothetical protein
LIQKVVYICAKYHEGFLHDIGYIGLWTRWKLKNYLYLAKGDNESLKQKKDMWK